MKHIIRIRAKYILIFEILFLFSLILLNPINVIGLCTEPPIKEEVQALIDYLCKLIEMEIICNPNTFPIANYCNPNTFLIANYPTRIKFEEYKRLIIWIGSAGNVPPTRDEKDVLGIYVSKLREVGMITLSESVDLINQIYQLNTRCEFNKVKTRHIL